MENSIVVENLTRVFQSKAKNKSSIVANANLSFEIRRGEIFGLLGPNGAGKTTLIHQLIGLLRPTSGSIWVENVDVVADPELVKPLIGFLPQTGLPMQMLEVERALLYTGRLRGLDNRSAHLQVNQFLEEFQLTSYAKRYVHTLSGGVLRLVNFAMALMGKPQVLVLDEPTNELDPHNRKMIWNKIAQLNRVYGLTCILVTHNVLEAERVVQRVAVMQNGKITAIGTPGEIKARSQGKLRLEFRLKEETQLTNQEQQGLDELGELEKLDFGQFRLYLPEKNLEVASAFLVRTVGLERLDDYRLSPPSLEDAYLDLPKTDWSVTL